MRAELKNLLMTAIPELADSIYDPLPADVRPPLPYLLLREVKVNQATANSRNVATYEVWPTVAKTNVAMADELASQIVNALHCHCFSLETIPHYIEYIGVAEGDSLQGNNESLSKGLRFQIHSLAWLEFLTDASDPVRAMISWTEVSFPHLQTASENWLPQNDVPALYWRLTKINSFQTVSWGAWLEVSIAGHLLYPEATVTNNYLQLIVEKLAKDGKTILSDGSKILFQSISTNHEENPFSAGQLNLIVHFGLLNDSLAYQSLKKFHLSDG